jgi:predicted enzyme related to lactoylglutathione lyase
MPTHHVGCRPVQIKIAVEDMAGAIAFYHEAFGFRYEVTRRTENEDHSSFVFGTYGQDGFFLIHLQDDPGEVDRLGPSTFGLLVDDLETVHARAIGAGGTEVVSPCTPEGMPRASAFAIRAATGSGSTRTEGSAFAPIRLVCGPSALLSRRVAQAEKPCGAR